MLVRDRLTVDCVNWLGLVIGFIGLSEISRNYTLQFTVTTRTSVHGHVFPSRCSVAASSNGRSRSSVFPN